jgi:glutathione S-transferase
MESVRFKLFHFPATRSARVKWMLHEVLGEDFEVEVVDLYRGGQYRPDYLARNPHHNVPALEVTFGDGSAMNMLESGAMVAWLADAFPKRALAPPPDALSRERADYLQMLHFGASTMDMMLWQIRIHEHVLADDQQDPRTAERYRAKFEAEVEPVLAARLTEHPFICGDRFTAADCVIGHNVTWARGYGMCRDEVFRDYLSRLSKRPAFAQAFADAREFDPQVPAPVRNAGKFNG